MPDLPTSWTALCVVVLLLGLRHGFDADHLAAIDGLTRLAASQRRAYTRYCGILFALGHGAVVLGVAAAVGLLSERWTPPGWLNAFGAWVSIAFLMLIGIGNLRAVLQAAPGTVVCLVGLKGPWISRLLPGRGPLGIAAVGALFALSFDTLSQSALFSVAATQYGGIEHALMLGLLFVLGMFIADGLNGWWIAHLIARADEVAALASRIMGVAVSGVSMLVAALGVAKLLSPAIEGWSGGKEVAVGAIVIGVIGASYLVALWLASPSSASQRQAA